MPLREDLLEPIAGDNPSGTDLYYDKVFDQIKEARTEDDDIGPAGDWGRAAKKADHVVVIKLAGETLAKRTKDLRLAGWLVESHFRREGFGVLVPCLDLLRGLQEDFWPTLYPEIEEDGNLDLRVAAIESVTNRVGLALRKAPITKAGLSMEAYRESRVLGYESPDMSSEKMAARQDAIKQGKVTAEDFDKAFAGTAKSFYVDSLAALEGAQERIDELDRFQEEKYGDDYPSTSKFRTALGEVKQIVGLLLNERRKTEPDADQVEEEVEDETPDSPAAADEAVEVEAASAGVAKPKKKAGGATLELTTPEDAYAAVLRAAEFLLEGAPNSPVPYLICAGMRLGETRMQGAWPEAGFAVGPSSETRQKLRALAVDCAWNDLLRAALPVLAEPCARAWLDLQRYIWRAARETGAWPLAGAVVSTVRGVLAERPELRHWTLEDDTATANPETQAWLDAEVVPPVAVEVASSQPEQPVYAAPVVSDAEDSEAESAVVTVHEMALNLLRGGRAGEAIAMMVRDAETQSSGRMRFRRRLQMAQMCVSAGHEDVAFAVLDDLTQEIDRRQLDTWEGSELLAPPLALLLKCLSARPDAGGRREAVFSKLCRIDPNAAMTAGR
jgi:type VI secretion system protein ImpA